MAAISFSKSLPQDSFVRVRALPHGISDVNADSILFERCCPVSAVESILTEYPKANIWRSWAVFSDPNCEDILEYFPWVIDIDIEGNTPELQNAHFLALALIDILQNKVEWKPSVQDLVVVFSGRKGFHLQFAPIRDTCLRDLRKLLMDEVSKKGVPREFNKFYGNVVVDTINFECKPWLRLIGSTYSWKEETGEIRSRRIMPFPAEEFRTLSLDAVIAKSEAG